MGFQILFQLRSDMLVVFLHVFWRCRWFRNVLEEERCHAVAVVAGDAVSSLETPEFLRRADQGCQDGLQPAWGCMDLAAKMRIFTGKTFFYLVFSEAI